MLLAQFLDQSKWAGWTPTVIAGDASQRRYLRLASPTENQTVIVMDAPADCGESVAPFIAIGRHLSDIGLVVPQILAADTKQGFLVLDDLGQTDLARQIATHPADEECLYGAAVDVLVRLQTTPAPAGLVALTPETAGSMVADVTEWHAPGQSIALGTAVTDAFRQWVDPTLVLSLRDYHAENLIWRADRHGADRVGLLDFQDAFLAHPGYDLVSLLRDARRDVTADVAAAMMERFVAATGADDGTFRATSACLAVQRNLRILGIFARLVKRDGKVKYAALMPRVWGHLMRDLAHPALADLRASVLDMVPPPAGGRA